MIIGTLVPMIEGHCLFTQRRGSALYSDVKKPSEAITIWTKSIIEKTIAYPQLSNIAEASS
jgi:hypothetical protein